MKSFAVIGCGRFGSSVAKTLYKLGYDVLAIDYSEEVTQNIAYYVTKAVTVSSFDENVLREVGVANCDVVIVGIGSDIEASVITTLAVKELGVGYILCKAGSEIQEKILYKIGANKVITPEKEMGMKIANNLVSENILDKIDLDPNYTIVEIGIPEIWVGKTLAELEIRKRYLLNVVATKKDDELNIVPNPNEILEEDTAILLVGKNEDLQKFENSLKN